MQKRKDHFWIGFILPLLAAFIFSAVEAAIQGRKTTAIQQVRIISSPAAQKRLGQGSEEMVVSTSWYGWPVAQGQATTGENGLVFLDRAETHLPARGGIAAIPLTAIKRARLSLIKGPVYTNVSAF